MKTYVLIVSPRFPKRHIRAGEPTYFREKIALGLLVMNQVRPEFCHEVERSFSGMAHPPYFDEFGTPPLGTIPHPVAPVVFEPKLHTVRGNYDLWKKRFEQIDAEEACLSVREWAGKPYASKQRELFRLTNTDGIGIQKLEIRKETHDMGLVSAEKIEYTFFEIDGEEHGELQDGKFPSHGLIELAKNDGLTWQEFKNWFTPYPEDPCAIIHFTKFRYK